MTWAWALGYTTPVNTSIDIDVIAKGYQAIADPTRLRILRVLEAGPHCVCQIQTELHSIAPNLLSHHLRVLREAGLVRAVRRGRWIDYSLDNPALEQLRAAIPTPGSSALLGACEVL